MYQDIPCALSSHSGGALSQSSSTASADTSYSLFVRPEIDILENDFLVISRLGKVIEALAGAADGSRPTIMFQFVWMIRWSDEYRIYL